MDTPGLLHHVRARGIERRRIFRSNRDREDFLDRLEVVCEGDSAFVYAWCLMPNHVHLAIRTGTQRLSRVMQRLLTGYAIRFNKRYQRVGHLFENRYRSKVVDDEPYLLALVRYIHLNPVRAGLVCDLAGLVMYPWCGHSALMGNVELPWQDTEAILARFGHEVGTARRRLLSFMSSAGAEKEEGLFREGGVDARAGAPAGFRQPHQAEEESSDHRILGSGRFVDSILQKSAQEREWWIRSTEERLRACRQVLRIVSERSGLSEEELTGGGRRRAVVEARSIVCHLAIHRLGMPLVDLSRELHVSPSNVLRGARRGGDLLRKTGWGDDLLC